MSEKPPSEDELSRTPDDTPEPSSDIPEFIPRPRGRPPGHAKTGGRLKGKVAGRKYSDEEAHSVLGSYMADVCTFHYDVMLGKTKVLVPTRPGHRPLERFPNLAERQESATWIAENFWRLDSHIKGLEEAEAEEVSEDELRRVLSAYYVPPSSPAAPPLTAAPEPVKEGDSVTTHLTSLDEIQKFERKQTAPDSSRTFKTGFSWKRTFDPNTNQPVWDLFNPAGAHCGVRRTQAKADAWCESGGVCT